MPIAIDRQEFALPRAVAADVEIFAVGDIHGRPDLLGALVDAAAREPRQRARRVLVFLGDLVDRGPDSLGAIDLGLRAGERIGADETIGLMGNHEALMRLAVDPATPWDDARDALQAWLANGGGRTIGEFADFDPASPDLDDLLRRVRATLPDAARRWLAGLAPHWRCGDVLFVHAGVNPRLDIDVFLAAAWDVPVRVLQPDRHWAWVRWPFIDHDPGPGGWTGLFIVHGHTPNDAEPAADARRQIAEFRLNLDAGSGHTGVAKMALLRGATAEVVAARGPTNREMRA